jgi:Protein of unknown function (DUF3577)
MSIPQGVMASPFFILEKENTMNTQTNVKNANPVNNQDSDVGYYDCHTTALCFINEVYTRQEGKKAPLETWVNLAVVQGDKSDPKYVKYNVRVVGTEAAQLIDVLKTYVNERSNDRSVNKVTARVVIGDTFPLIVTQKRGEGEGTVYPLIKGRLLKITYARVKCGDSIVFERRANQTNESQQQEPAPRTGTEG